MKQAREVLICGLLLAAVVLLAMGAQLLYTTNVVLLQMPKLVSDEIDRTRAEVLAEVDTVRSSALSAINGQGDALRKELLRQLAVMNPGGKADAALLLLDKQLTQANLTLADRSAELPAVLRGIEGLTVSYAALANDAKDSADDLYWDVKASVESGTVAMHSAAVASEAVAAAAPKLAESTVGIAADVRREADSIVKPKRWYEKILGPVYTAARLVALFL